MQYLGHVYTIKLFVVSLKFQVQPGVLETVECLAW